MADDPKFSVSKIAFELNEDIDPDASCDVKEVDEKVFACLSLAKEALDEGLSGFSEFSVGQIRFFIEGMSHSHRSVRKLLSGERSACSVDALAIARLQVENVFTGCYLLESEENVRLLVKNAWKTKYVRHLLHMRETAKLKRFADFFETTGLSALDSLQGQSFVTHEERDTIEVQQLELQREPQWKPVRIAGFPGPAKVAKIIKSDELKPVLKRLNAEYEFLCSFAHGDAESLIFRTVVDDRSSARQVFFTSEIEEFYQKQVLEPPIYYSALSSLFIATEVAAHVRTAVDLRIRLAEAWSHLLNMSLWFRFAWDLRARKVLGLIA